MFISNGNFKNTLLDDPFGSEKKPVTESNILKWIIMKVQ